MPTTTTIGPAGLAPFGVTAPDGEVPIEAIDARITATRGNLVSAIENIGWLRRVGADRRKGYPSWHAFVLDVFGDLLPHLQLPEEEQVELLASMRRDQTSLRRAAELTGLSTGTVRNRLAKVDPASLPATTVGKDGRVRAAGTARPAPAPPAAVPAAQPPQEPQTAPAGVPRGGALVPVRKTDTAVRLVAEAMPGGLTEPQVRERTGWEHQEASPTLTRLVQAGRLAYLAPAKRGQHGRYVLPTPAV